jgi:hypothetical protein
MPDLAQQDHEAMVTLLLTSLSVDLKTTAAALGVSYNRAAEEVRATGKIAGIAVIHTGASGKHIRVPARALARLLQIDSDPETGTP